MPRQELCLDDMQRVQSTELEKEYVVKVREGGDVLNGVFFSHQMEAALAETEVSLDLAPC